jgi:hypothetical protein
VVTGRTGQRLRRIRRLQTLDARKRLVITSRILTSLDADPSVCADARILRRSS